MSKVIVATTEQMISVRVPHVTIQSDEWLYSTIISSWTVSYYGVTRWLKHAFIIQCKMFWYWEAWSSYWGHVLHQMILSVTRASLVHDIHLMTYIVCVLLESLYLTWTVYSLIYRLLRDIFQLPSVSWNDQLWSISKWRQLLYWKHSRDTSNIITILVRIKKTPEE